MADAAAVRRHQAERGEHDARAEPGRRARRARRRSRAAAVLRGTARGRGGPADLRRHRHAPGRLGATERPHLPVAGIAHRRGRHLRAPHRRGEPPARRGRGELGRARAAGQRDHHRYPPGARGERRGGAADRGHGRRHPATHRARSGHDARRHPGATAVRALAARDPAHPPCRDAAHRRPRGLSDLPASRRHRRARQPALTG